VPILLQKSAGADRRSANWLGETDGDRPALTLSTQLPRYAMHRARVGGGRATSDASRRKFCAVAARTNSSCAPRGPRSRSRPSFSMQSRCANRVSIFLRSRRDCSKVQYPQTNGQRLGRVRGCRAGSCAMGFEQHCGLSGHTSQSSWLARHRSVLPSCTVPLVPSRFPPGQR
jgi:hypothetical protein